MFSYLNVVKELVEDGVFQRGIRYYLDGQVSSFDDLVLDNWRLYEVKGTEFYQIKIPLLHLALSSNKFKKAHLAMQQTVTCNCEYFASWGFCKHIVAVCASLDNEFSLQLLQTKEDLNNQNAGQFLDNIFEADFERSKREFFINLDKYLIRPDALNAKKLENFVHNFSASEKLEADFFSSYKKWVLSNIKDYDKEKQLVKVARSQIIFGGQSWFKLWLDCFSKMHENNLINLVFQLWQDYQLGLLNGIKNSIANFFVGLDSNFKTSLMKMLEAQSNSDFNKQLQLALDLKLWPWIQQNIPVFDPIILIKIAELWPDSQEEIEPFLYEKIKVWSDFLNSANEANELIEMVNLWQIKLGRTEKYEQLVTYIKENHKRKYGLLKKLKNLL